jgi:murein DD-endopeptidase MepM/ murein hydrolase activator NlpD
MQTALSRSVNAALGRLLPERRLFIRSEQSTRYVHLTPLSQLGAAVLLAGGIGWSIHASTAVVTGTIEAERAALDRAAIERAVAARLGDLKAERDRLAAELEVADTARAEASDRLGEMQDRLLSAEAELREGTVERRGLQDELDRLLARRADDAARISSLESQLREARLALLEGADEPAEAPNRDVLPSMMLSGAMSEVIAERDRALAEAERLDRRVAALNAEIDGWRDRQEIALAKIEEAVRTGLDGLSGMLERADLDIDSILAQTRAAYSGTGGPFEPLSEQETAALERQGDQRIAALMRDLERVNLMRIAVDRLPFGRPVTGVRLTSGFGKRRDPFRGTWSMHSGVDWAGPRGTPVRATAGGVVTFAGRMSGYGKVVVIRHGFGHETRYAHLRRALVKEGQRVRRGEQIAEMGNTGRSTGTHLHYEVRIDDDPVNPKKFIEAARDVL